MYILRFIQKTSSKSKSSDLTDCSELDRENILSECRIVGALEGTRMELGVGLVRIQLYTYWCNTAVQNLKKTTGAGLLNAGKSLETRTNASLLHSRNTCCNSICIAQKDGIM